MPLGCPAPWAPCWPSRSRALAIGRIFRGPRVQLSTRSALLPKRVPVLAKHLLLGVLSEVPFDALCERPQPVCVRLVRAGGTRLFCSGVELNQRWQDEGYRPDSAMNLGQYRSISPSPLHLRGCEGTRCSFLYRSGDTKWTTRPMLYSAGSKLNVTLSLRVVEPVPFRPLVRSLKLRSTFRLSLIHANTCALHAHTGTPKSSRLQGCPQTIC